MSVPSSNSWCYYRLSNFEYLVLILADPSPPSIIVQLSEEFGGIERWLSHWLCPTLQSVKLIGFSFLETYLHFAEHVQRTYGTRLCTILLRLTKRKRGNNPISIHRDLRFLFLFLFLPSFPLFFTSTKISSG